MTDFLNRRWPALLTVMLITYGLVLAIFSREGFPASMDYGHGMPYLSDRPVGEDGFYMLTVAWNIAEKGRIVYNLDKPTTGIQPLATFLYAAVARVVQLSAEDRWLFVRAVIVVNVLLMTVFARQIGRIARALTKRREEQELAYALGVVTTLSSMWVFREFTYGLETGLYLVLLASFVLLTLQNDRPLNPIALGLLAGVTGLARLDFGLIFGLQLLWLLRERRLRLREAIVAGVIALLITVPWLLWVHVQTGIWVPSSAGAQLGQISTSDASLRLNGMGRALLWNITPWISSSDNDLRFVRWSAVALAAFLALTLPAVYAHRKGRITLTDWWYGRQFAAWTITVAALVPVYLIGSWAWHFYGRYTSPLLVVTVPAVAILATIAGRRLKWLPVAMLALSPVMFVMLASVQLHHGHMILDLPINAGFVSNELDGNLRVGAAQSGSVGFFNQNVINLDGKIDAQARYSIGHGGIGSYIDAEHIDVLVDWPEVYRTFLFAGHTGEHWQLCDRQPAGKSRCYRRNPDSTNDGEDHAGSAPLSPTPSADQHVKPQPRG